MNSQRKQFPRLRFWSASATLLLMRRVVRTCRVQETHQYEVTITKHVLPILLGGWENYRIDPRHELINEQLDSNEAYHAKSTATSSTNTEGKESDGEAEASDNEAGSEVGEVEDISINIDVTSLHEEASEDCDFDRVHLHAVTNSYFMKRYFIEPRPLLIKGGASRYASDCRL